MRRLLPYLVTLPLAVALFSTASLKTALAAGEAEQAVRLLSQAKAADAKCNYLSGRDSRDLSRFIARAELAATSQMSSGAAMSAARKGNADGSAAPCSPAAGRDVKDTLEAARVAIAAADNNSPDQSRAARRAARSKAVAEEEPRRLPRSGGGLGLYGRVVESYYVERKCRHLAKSDADRFWRSIVRLHKSAVNTAGADAVEPVMRRAEQAARATSCGGDTEAMVLAGYAKARRY